jgi:hypothetical protein
MIEMAKEIDSIIKRNEELFAEMGKCPLGDTMTLLKIKNELIKNNQEIQEWATNLWREKHE